MIDVEPSTFADVAPGDRPPRACYPSLPNDPNWRGVTIALPNRVRFEVSTDELHHLVNIVLCGVCVVPVPPEPDPVGLVFRIRRSGAEEWTETPLTDVPPPGIEHGPLEPLPDVGPATRPPPPADMSVQTKFYRNLLDYVNLAPGTTDYEVAVRLREYVSNVASLHIDWVEPSSLPHPP